MIKELKIQFQKYKGYILFIIILILFLLGIYNIFIQNKKGIDITNKMYSLSIQEKSLSCESSATSDIISTLLQNKVTEDDVISFLNKSRFNKLPIEENGKVIWGNPNVGFVGYIDKIGGKNASQRRYEGYGVYEYPISQVYSKYGLKSKIINNLNRKEKGINNSMSHLKLLLEELEKGNYIQLWGDWCTVEQFDDGKEIDKKLNTKLAQSISTKNYCKYIDDNRELEWYYYDDKGKLREFIGLNGEHAFILLGYKGNIENPTYIIIWDTNTGKHILPTQEWLRKWNRVQDRSIIIYR